MHGDDQLDWLETRIDHHVRNIRLRQQRRRFVRLGWAPACVAGLAAVMAIRPG